MPIEPWWETNPATTPCQELGMVSPELQLEFIGCCIQINGTPFHVMSCSQFDRPLIIGLWSVVCHFPFGTPRFPQTRLKRG